MLQLGNFALETRSHRLHQAVDQGCGSTANLFTKSRNCDVRGPAKPAQA